MVNSKWQHLISTKNNVTSTFASFNWAHLQNLMAQFGLAQKVDIVSTIPGQMNFPEFFGSFG